MKAVVLGLISIILLACTPGGKHSSTEHAGWVTLKLLNGWSLSAPPGFTAEVKPGLNPRTGYIRSKSDGISLVYDRGTTNEKKDMEQTYAESKYMMDSGFYQNMYQIPYDHTGTIDTVDNKIATIIQPVVTGHGTVAMILVDHNTGEWIDMRGTNFSPEQERLILEILRTLRFKDVK